MTTDDYTVLSSVFGKGPGVQNVLNALYEFHEWVASLHGADPGPGKLIWVPDGTTPWYTAQVAKLMNGEIPSFKCRRTPGMQWFRKPTDATFFNASPPGDTGEMDVWNTQVVGNVLWFLVYKSTTAQIWVKALDVAAP